ncbi:hypothetical protein HBP16_05630, partial [Staphylococcus aureus]|nr:hypothetical protein [Staphylococcus aureus]
MFKVNYSILSYYPDIYLHSNLAMFKRRKNNKKQDLILLRQEALEHYLMNKYNYYYKETH